MLGRQAVQQVLSHMDIASQPPEPRSGKRWVLWLEPTHKPTCKSTTEQRGTPASSQDRAPAAKIGHQQWVKPHWMNQSPSSQAASHLHSTFTAATLLVAAVKEQLLASKHTITPLAPAAPTLLVAAVKEQLLASKHTITPLAPAAPTLLVAAVKEQLLASKHTITKEYILTCHNPAVLCGPAKKPLQVLGQCKIDLSHRGRSTKQQLFVVAELKSNLLGLPAIQDLNLAVRLDGTTADTTPLTAPYIHKRFPKLFQGLGNLGEEYQIKLKLDATPFSLFTPRRVPLPLREKVKEELEQM